MSKKTIAIIKKTEKYVLGTYNRLPVAFKSGQGSWLTTYDGKMFLDFFPGWGVSNLGHCHPRVVQAITRQSKKIIHLANVFHIPEQSRLAEAIVKKAFPGKVFFSNSGAESVECALKAAKSYGQNLGKKEIIAFKQSFHGRTTGAVTLTGQPAYQKTFRPLLPGIRYATFNDLQSVKKLLSNKTAGIILEPIQGEGGIHVATPEFLQGLRKLTNQHRALLILDEVQTGFGRTGKFFGYQHFGIHPDILCMAKSIAGGVPMGATLLAKKYTGVLPPGTHASTFGGNYLAAAAGLAVMRIFDREKILPRMKAKEKMLVRFFKEMMGLYPEITECRHLGFMFGLQMKPGLAAACAARAFEKGLIINCTAKSVLRIMPALNIANKDLLTGKQVLREVLKDVLGR